MVTSYLHYIYLMTKEICFSFNQWLWSYSGIRTKLILLNCTKICKRIKFEQCMYKIYYNFSQYYTFSSHWFCPYFSNKFLSCSKYLWIFFLSTKLMVFFVYFFFSFPFFHSRKATITSCSLKKYFSNSTFQFCAGNIFLSLWQY